MVELTVRRTIAATPERLFAAWTDPRQLVEWWGPDGVTCIEPTVDLRVGGHYRIGNRLPSGQHIWISGVFEIIEPPYRLTYTWRLEGHDSPPERVTVRFEPCGDATDVIVRHERIATLPLREQHENGWRECLAGLATFLA
jgi:uncharacterized protein YndB with AHSA1/START domain